MIRFTVDNMSCGGCAASIRLAVAAIDPQAEIKIDVKSRDVQVTGTASEAAVRAAVADAGYRIAGGSAGHSS
jgi:copper chaperone